MTSLQQRKALPIICPVYMCLKTPLHITAERDIESDGGNLGKRHSVFS